MAERLMPSAEQTGLSPAEVETMRSVEDDLWWYRALRGHVLHTLSLIGERFELLDAGCGSGGMLARIHERFPRATLTGLDVTERALELSAKRKLDATLVHGRTDELPFAAESFDVVLSLDVLVVRGVDAAAAVAEMHRVLRPGGRLIVNLPAFEFLRGSHDVAVNNVCRMTKSQLEKLVARAGFRLERWTYWNATLVPAIAVVRLASRRRARQPQVRSDLKPMFAPLNLALTALAKTELAFSRVVPLPLGSSLFAVARK